MPDFHRGFGSTTMAQMAASHFPSSPTPLAVHARYREALGCGVGAVEPGADLVAPGAGLLGGPSYIARQALPASTWHSWHSEEVAHKVTSQHLRETDAECDALAKELDLTRRELEQAKLSLDELGNEYQAAAAEGRRANDALREARGETAEVQQQLTLARKTIEDLKAAHNDEIQSMVKVYNEMLEDNRHSLRHHYRAKYHLTRQLSPGATKSQPVRAYDDDDDDVMAVASGPVAKLVDEQLRG